MTFTANQLTSITVLARDGATKGVLDGNVVLAAGDGIRIDVDGTDLTFNAGAVYSSQESRYQRKFQTVLDGGTFTDDDGTLMTFSGMPYYVAAIGGVQGNYVNNFDFLSNACGQVGIGSSILDGDGSLPLLDICQACIDCEDYALIVTLMSRIEEYQDFDVERNLDSTEDGMLALFRQYQALLHYWNYLVHQKCFPLEAIRGSTTYFVVKAGYLNMGAGTYTCTQTYTVYLTWASDVGELAASITNVVRRPDALSDPAVSVTPTSDDTYEIVVEYPALTYRQMALYELVIKTSEKLSAAYFITVWTDSHTGAAITKTRTRLVP